MIAEKLKRFKAQDMGRAIELGIVSQLGVMISSPGGTGKSMIAKWIARQMGLTPFIQVFTDDLTISKLFGGINAKKFTETGEEEYLLEKSFVNHEFVICEEILDGAPSVLEAFKDVITSGYVYNGSQVFKSRVKYLIALTNVKRSEFLEEVPRSRLASIEAVFDRFPIYIHYSPDILEDFGGYLGCIGRDEENDPINMQELEKLQEKAKQLSQEELEAVREQGRTETSLALEEFVDAYRKTTGRSLQLRKIYQIIKTAGAAAAIQGCDRIKPRHLEVVRFLLENADEAISATLSDFLVDPELLEKAENKLSKFLSVLKPVIESCSYSGRINKSLYEFINKEHKDLMDVIHQIPSQRLRSKFELQLLEPMAQFRSFAVSNK